MNWVREWFRRRERRWVEQRVQEVVHCARAVVGNQPFVLFGRWSWTDRHNPIEVHVIFPYLPAAFQVMSWYDVDRRLCQWATGDFERRRSRLSQLRHRAEQVRLLLITVSPDQWLDEGWMRAQLAPVLSEVQV